MGCFEFKELHTHIIAFAKACLNYQFRLFPETALGFDYQVWIFSLRLTLFCNYFKQHRLAFEWYLGCLKSLKFNFHSNCSHFSSAQSQSEYCEVFLNLF